MGVSEYFYGYLSFADTDDLIGVGVVRWCSGTNFYLEMILVSWNESI
jgi:hypothetical protein